MVFSLFMLLTTTKYYNGYVTIIDLRSTPVTIHRGYSMYNCLLLVNYYLPLLLLLITINILLSLSITIAI